MSDLPLIALAEGADQDDRSDIYVAYRRCAQWQKVTPTNLHLRELLFWVNAVDRDRRGVQVSYEQIAAKLELASARAARGVVQRAEEWGLLEVIEARYQRGGQSANRYRVNWPLVRAIRDGLDDGNPWRKRDAIAEPPPQQPGDAERHGGDAGGQGGDAERHPYKEHTRTKTRTKTIHSQTTNSPTTTEADRSDGWAVVVSEISGLGVNLAAEAVDTARARGFAVGDVRDLVAEYRKQKASGASVTPGWLYRWLIGKSAPEEPKPPPGVRGGGLTADEIAAEALRKRIIQAGRRAGAPESEILRRCEAAGV